jgi:hypothetical protein
VAYPVPAPPGPSALTIHTTPGRNLVAALLAPTANINGYNLALKWGANVIPAPPGVHRIHIYCDFLWRMGAATIIVDNTTAPAPPMYYAAPWTIATRGAIGFQPVKSPGLYVHLLIAAPGGPDRNGPG